MLVGRVADAAAVAHEDHAGGQPLGQHTGVVAGEADELGRGDGAVVVAAAASAPRTSSSNVTPALCDWAWSSMSTPAWLASTPATPSSS